ncbi:MAG: HNH endonuclease signature motif containing protein, partial [Acidimicrobiales bacterium]
LEMARRATSTKPGAKAPEPLTIIVMDYDTYVTEGLRHAGIELEFGSDSVYTDVISRLIDGTPIDPATAFEVAMRGQLSRIVMQGKSTIIDAGTSTRFFTGALRKALIVRDPTCSWPGCEAPSIHAEMDHIVDYADGGATSARNGQPYCRFHHAKKHSPDFNVYLDDHDTRHHDRADGTPIQPLRRGPP